MDSEVRITFIYYFSGSGNCLRLLRVYADIVCMDLKILSYGVLFHIWSAMAGSSRIY